MLFLKRRLRTFLIVSILVLLGLVITAVYYFNYSRHKISISSITTVPSVTIERLNYQILPLTVTSFGQVVSPVSVRLSAQSSGIISAIQFIAGQSVHKGDILFTLQSNDTSAQLDQLEAQTHIAKQYYDKDQELAKTGAIAQIDVLQAESTYQQDLAQYQEAKVIHTIVAPINGTISDTDLAVGDFVNVGDMLASITDSRGLQVKYQLPSQYQAQIHTGQAVIFTSDNMNKRYFATVVYVSPSLSNSNYSVTLRANLNGDSPPLNTVGSVVQVLDPNHQILALPQGVIKTDSQGFYIYFVDDHHLVVKRYFTPGAVMESGLITVQSGLSAGMEIITSNPDSFDVGKPVRVTTS